MLVVYLKIFLFTMVYFLLFDLMLCVWGVNHVVNNGV
jgi:hypothetical protein